MIQLNTTMINLKNHIEDGINYGRHLKLEINPMQITDAMLATISTLGVTALTLDIKVAEEEINWNLIDGNYIQLNLDFLRDEAFKQVKYLDCQANYLNDISAVTDLPHLENFKCHIRFHPRFDFSQIKNMKKLNISYKLGYTKGLPKCKQLESLTVFYYKHIPGEPLKDMSDFATLENLKYLDFRNSHIHTLDGLQYLAKLETLKISHLWNLKTIAALKGNKNIRHLSISHCEQIEDMEIVGTMTNLDSFSIYPA